MHSWTPVQRRWLDPLAKQLTHGVVIDEQFVNRAFTHDGGVRGLGGQLDSVIDELTEHLWDRV